MFLILIIQFVLLEFRHPDKNKDPEANERFMKINEAYEVSRVIIIISWLSQCTGCGKKSGPLKFFAVFSATVYDFNMKFYCFI